MGLELGLGLSIMYKYRIVIGSALNTAQPRKTWPPQPNYTGPAQPGRSHLQGSSCLKYGPAWRDATALCL